MKETFSHTIKYLTTHLSLLFIVLGAGCLFISNFFLKDIISDEDYGKYSIVITYISVMYLFGILGTEQGFLRFSFKREQNTIEIHKSQLILSISLALISSFLSYIFFKNYFSIISINNGLLFFGTLSVVLLLFLYNVLRLNEDYILSQLVANYWKIFLLIVTLYFFFFDVNDFDCLINAIFINIIFSCVCTILFILLKVKFIFSEKKINLWSTFFHFFVSIATFTIATFIDRFVIEYKFSTREFGDYFYLSNLIIAPFSILQNYIGFKKLVKFKKNFTISIFLKQNQDVVKIGFLMAIANIVLILILSYLSIVKFKFESYFFIIILLSIIGILRLYSSSILSAFEAKVSMENLKKSNIYVILITVIILFLQLFISNSMESILIFVALIWLIRSLIQRYLLIKQFKK